MWAAHGIVPSIGVILFLLLSQFLSSGSVSSVLFRNIASNPSHFNVCMSAKPDYKK